MTNVLLPLGKRTQPTDAFIFGRPDKPILIVPKANQLFTNQDGLWYFYTVRNPAQAAEAAPTLPAPPSAKALGGQPAPSDATAAKAPAAPGAPVEAARPRIMTTIGVLRNGKPAFQPKTSPAELDPFGSDTWGEGKEIPLEKFEPGFYTFVIAVRDMNAPRDSAPWKGFERRANFVVLKPDGSMPDKPAPEKPAPTAGTQGARQEGLGTGAFRNWVGQPLPRPCSNPEDPLFLWVNAATDLFLACCNVVDVLRLQFRRFFCRRRKLMRFRDPRGIEVTLTNLETHTSLADALFGATFAFPRAGPRGDTVRMPRSA